MTIVKQKVFLISEKQREALLNYLIERPYREVAIAVQILAKAPTTEVDIEIPDTPTDNVIAPSDITNEQETESDVKAD